MKRNEKHETIAVVRERESYNLREKARISKRDKGITLVSLVVTIVILIILTMVAINLIIGDNGIITRAYEAKYLTELSTCIEELHMFTYARELENDEFEPTSITAGENSLIYNTQPEGEDKNIYDIITN